MKLILNPTKPIYLDKKKKNIRCGNFPETGREINYEDDIFIEFFTKMKNGIEIEKLNDFALNECNISSEEFDAIIKYLLEEKVIMKVEDLEIISSSDVYNRQNMYFYMMSDEIKTPYLYKEKNILVLGLGGIGSIVAELLVRAGFQNLTIVDYDKVEKSNLIRQAAYYVEDVDKLKIDALEQRLKSINSACNIKKVNCEILNNNDLVEYIHKSDFVISTLDKPVRRIRRIVNEVCINRNKPVIFAGFAEHVGMIGPFIIPNQTACLECEEKNMSEEFLDNIQITPSFGPLCNIIASIVSAEVINYFVNYNANNLIGCTLMINMYNYDINKIKWHKNNNCKRCGDKNDSKQFE